MKVCWICLCLNEIDILPFVSAYWERVADKVVVFDNGSTDGSIEYLKKLPYVELRHFDSNGQNDIIQKEVKEKAYLEFKDSFDIIIITDMDEVFYFKDFEALGGKMIEDGHNCIIVPIYSLCEDSKPIYDEDKLLHQQCHKFYKQKMNHMKNFEDVSKVSIFNCHTVESIQMSVGQHYVYAKPRMMVMLSNDGFCLHLDKGFGWKYFCDRRKKMGDNLSEVNKNGGLCFEYLRSEEESKKEYLKKQENCFDINEKILF